MSRRFLFTFLGTIACWPTVLLAAFDVSMWNLSTYVIQDTEDLPISDVREIHNLSNPLNHVSLAQINQSYISTEYDYSWLTELATGTFNTDITLAIRAPEVFTSSLSAIFIVPTEDIRVSVNASLTYSHTPGDESGIGIGFGIRNMTTNQTLFQQSYSGGNLYLEPSSGTYAFSHEMILTPGTTYRIQYGIGADNNPDFLHPPTGIIDASGYVNIDIQPVVPEISTAAMLLVAAPALLRRRKRGVSIARRKSQSADVYGPAPHITTYSFICGPDEVYIHML